MYMNINLNDLSVANTAGFPVMPMAASSMPALQQVKTGYAGDSTMFSNEMSGLYNNPQSGPGDLSGFSSAWGGSQLFNGPSQLGLSGYGAQSSPMEAVYQQMLSSSFLSMMKTFMEGLCSMYGQNGVQNNGAQNNGGLVNQNGGADGANGGVNDAAGTDGKNDTTPVNVPKGGTLSGKQLVEVLKQAGFTGEGLKMAWAIAMRESGGKPSAFNGNAGTGDKSYGLFQINMLGNLGPARLKELGLNSNEDLLDPLTNAKAAYKMSKGGTDFGAWAVGPNAYRRSASLDAAIQKYLKEFPG